MSKKKKPNKDSKKRTKTNRFRQSNITIWKQKIWETIKKRSKGRSKSFS